MAIQQAFEENSVCPTTQVRKQKDAPACELCAKDEEAIRKQRELQEKRIAEEKRKKAEAIA